jgi:hypothetical protein
MTNFRFLILDLKENGNCGGGPCRAVLPFNPKSKIENLKWKARG